MLISVVGFPLRTRHRVLRTRHFGPECPRGVEVNPSVGGLAPTRMTKGSLGLDLRGVELDRGPRMIFCGVSGVHDRGRPEMFVNPGHRRELGRGYLKHIVDPE